MKEANCPIIPVNGRYLIELIDKPNTTSSGFYLPDSVDKGQRSSEGKILAIPDTVPGKKEGNETKPKFQVNQHVYFGSYNGTEVYVSEKKYLLLHEEDIVGIKN